MCTFSSVPSYIHARYSSRDGNFKLGQKNKKMDLLSEPYTMNGMYFIDYRNYNRAVPNALTELVVRIISIAVSTLLTQHVGHQLQYISSNGIPSHQVRNHISHL